ncbi:MFS transporter [Bacillus suaedaesalsae]|uniref:MFS transporter n=1 Tax=Bacillus suaedaesalsae TaxID=2810349 RepID=A0ABS2DI77_9BACI|nr:MFS transporter [Bacillus suaedaesalsae]MBM6617715.1 MFS transporter [Bacillus suaedaesalsae]
MKTIPFYSYWFSKTSIALADVIYIMVITTFIYQETKSALIASLFPLFKAAANLIAGLSSPFLYNKYSFTKLVGMLQLIKAIILTLLLIGFNSITSHIYVLLLFILVISFMEGWGNPLLNSITPRVVAKETLVKANSILSISTQSVQIAGYSFTGFIVIQWGHHPTLAFNVVLLWLSVLCLFMTMKSIKVPSETEVRQSKWGLMKQGWNLIYTNKTLRMITLMDVIEGMAGSIWIGAVTLVYVEEALHQGEEWWGYVNASYYIGSIIGGFLTLYLARFIQKNLIVSMSVGSLLFSIFTLIYGLTSIPILALLLCIAMGPAYQIRDVAQQTAFQLNIPAEHLPKVYASQSILISSITGLSIFLMGFIAEFIGVRAVYVLGSILIFTSSLLSFTLVRGSKIERAVSSIKAN